MHLHQHICLYFHSLRLKMTVDIPKGTKFGSCVPKGTRGRMSSDTSDRHSTDLAEHECSTNWGECKSKSGKPEHPEKNISEQS